MFDLRKVLVVTKTQRNRNILDDIAEQVGEMLNDLERLITGKQKPVRAPVPVPVRHDEDPRRQRRNPNPYQ